MERERGKKTADGWRTIDGGSVFQHCDFSTPSYSSINRNPNRDHNRNPNAPHGGYEQINHVKVVWQERNSAWRGADDVKAECDHGHNQHEDVNHGPFAQNI